MALVVTEPCTVLDGVGSRMVVGSSVVVGGGDDAASRIQYSRYGCIASSVLWYVTRSVRSASFPTQSVQSL